MTIPATINPNNTFENLSLLNILTQQNITSKMISSQVDRQRYSQKISQKLKHFFLTEEQNNQNGQNR